MKNILKLYVDKFNKDDIEYYKQDIANIKAEEWMRENIPLIEIPDKTIEEIYYFRWWVFRKHIKSTEDGYVITEFLPNVPWGGKHNTIIAAAGHHVAEAKWLKNGKKIAQDYIKFWLEEKGRTYLYSSWIIYSLYELCMQTNDFSFAIENIDLLVSYYEKVYAEHITDSGLLWSIDNNDAMEFSISGGCLDENERKGLRPTLNSYMAANAWAISEIAKKAGNDELADKYAKRYTDIKEKMAEFLWDGEFYKAIHAKNLEEPSISKILPNHNVKELIGYIPWCFNLAPDGFEDAFSELKQKDGFKSEYGLTTAERRHPRYLYEKNHECLWNGYIWPFATSQVLNAVKNLLNNYNQNVIRDEDFYDILHTYARSHYRITNDTDKICWIDEVMHPETGEWSSRSKLKALGWKEELGGVERGKDYNHSTFCDNVLGGLLGVSVVDGEVLVNPHIPENWDYFAIDNLWINDKCYKIIYDKHGEKYGFVKGISILQK